MPHQYFHLNVLVVLQRQCKFKKDQLPCSLYRSLILCWVFEKSTHTLPPDAASSLIICWSYLCLEASDFGQLRSPPHHRPLNAEPLPPPAPALSLKRLLMLTYHNFKVRFEYQSFNGLQKVTIPQGRILFAAMIKVLTSSTATTRKTKKIKK